MFRGACLSLVLLTYIVAILATSVDLRNAEGTNCKLCDAELFGNNTLLTGEFLKDYDELRMQNSSIGRPPKLFGTFRGTWAKALYGQEMAKARVLQSPQGVVVYQLNVESSAETHNDGPVQLVKGEVVVRDGTLITDSDIHMAATGVYIPASGGLHLALEPQFPIQVEVTSKETQSRGEAFRSALRQAAHDFLVFQRLPLPREVVQARLASYRQQQQHRYQKQPQTPSPPPSPPLQLLLQKTCTFQLDMRAYYAGSEEAKEHARHLRYAARQANKTATEVAAAAVASHRTQERADTAADDSGSSSAAAAGRGPHARSSDVAAATTDDSESSLTDNDTSISGGSSGRSKAASGSATDVLGGTSLAASGLTQGTVHADSRIDSRIEIVGAGEGTAADPDGLGERQAREGAAVVDGAESSGTALSGSLLTSSAMSSSSSASASYTRGSSAFGVASAASKRDAGAAAAAAATDRAGTLASRFGGIGSGEAGSSGSSSNRKGGAGSAAGRSGGSSARLTGPGSDIDIEDIGRTLGVPAFSADRSAGGRSGSGGLQRYRYSRDEELGGFATAELGSAALEAAHRKREAWQRQRARENGIQRARENGIRPRALLQSWGEADANLPEEGAGALVQPAGGGEAAEGSGGAVTTTGSSSSGGATVSGLLGTRAGAGAAASGRGALSSSASSSSSGEGSSSSLGQGPSSSSLQSEAAARAAATQALLQELYGDDALLVGSTAGGSGGGTDSSMVLYSSSSSASSSLNDDGDDDDDDRMDPDDPDLDVVGMLYSPNCDFALVLNSTTVHLERIYRKAVHYSLMTTLITFTQVLLLVRQMDMTSTPSTAARVSLYAATHQAIMDAYLCLVHLTSALVMDALFNAFAAVAFFQFLLFAIFEMRHILVVWRAQRPTQDLSVVRRELSLLYARFYALLLAGIFLVFQLQRQMHVVLLAVFSWWVPQVVHCIYINAKPPLQPGYLWGTSVCRLALPLYFFGCPHNLLKVSPRPWLCAVLVGWVAAQALVLTVQMHFGPRSFIPKACLPKKYEYHRPATRRELGEDYHHQQHYVPGSGGGGIGGGGGGGAGGGAAIVTARGSTGSGGAGGASGARALAVAAAASRQGAIVTTGPGLGAFGTLRLTLRSFWSSAASAVMGQQGAGCQPGTTGGGHGSGLGGGGGGALHVGDVETGHGSRECVICMCPVPIMPPSARMLTPCGHFFHEHCLLRWMEVKLECPTCRRQLPPHEP